MVAHFDPEFFDQNADIAVAYNGWLYIAFSTAHTGPPGTDLGIVISKDSGLTWHTFPSFVLGTHNILKVNDINVIGNDSSSLRIYITYSNLSDGYPYSLGGIAVFDGLTGAA